jgi:hypothetical protein
MSYLKIPNLYKNQDILLFKECFAMEKIHGTSTHISWKNNSLSFFSGGTKHENFVSLFDQEFLISKFKEIGHDEITVFGEGYGGKEQGMKKTYGDKLKFIAFEVKIGDSWLNVEHAENICKFLGLEFVHYVKISTDLKEIDAQRDADSVQAIRNGCGAGHIREGIILHPLIEVRKNNGERIIAKHKRDEFRETKTPRPIVDPERLKVLNDAELIAKEWVTKNRLEHILQKIPDYGIEKMSDIIGAMINDIKIEGAGEIVWTKDVEKIISRETALLFKNEMKKNLYK